MQFYGVYTCERNFENFFAAHEANAISITLPPFKDRSNARIAFAIRSTRRPSSMGTMQSTETLHFHSMRVECNSSMKLASPITRLLHSAVFPVVSDTCRNFQEPNLSFFEVLTPSHRNILLFAPYDSVSLKVLRYQYKRSICYRHRDRALRNASNCFHPRKFCARRGN